MIAFFSFRPARFLTTFLVAAAILTQGVALAGPIKKQGFDKLERAKLERLETKSESKTSKVRGRSGKRLLEPGRILLIAGLVGIGIWAANADAPEDECIINGTRIDPNSSECRRAAHLAESHSDE